MTGLCPAASVTAFAVMFGHVPNVCANVETTEFCVDDPKFASDAVPVNASASPLRTASVYVIVAVALSMFVASQ